MTPGPAFRHSIHPLQAFLLAAALPLFLGALLCDWAYSSTYQIQWTNFASWLIAGALVFAGLALTWAVLDLLRIARSRNWALYVLALAATFVLGLLNAFVHARDAWATMPAGMILSLLVLVLAAAAAWSGFSTLRTGDVR